MTGTINSFDYAGWDWIKTLVCELAHKIQEKCNCRNVSSGIISSATVMRSCGWLGGGLVTSCFIWAQLDLMFKRRTEAEPEQHQHCHYSDRADGLSWEEWGNKKSEDKHTFTHIYIDTDTHLTDITVTQFKQEKNGNERALKHSHWTCCAFLMFS